MAALCCQPTIPFSSYTFLLKRHFSPGQWFMAEGEMLFCLLSVLYRKRYRRLSCQTQTRNPSKEFLVTVRMIKFCPFRNQRITEPGAMPSRNSTLTFSPSSAAKIIPLLSTPQSTAGFRLATSTTVLPMSSSGV